VGEAVGDVVNAGARVDVVGLLGGVPYGPDAERALRGAQVVVGSARQLGEAGIPLEAEAVPLRGPLEDVLAVVDERSAAGARVCVLASGDPGFFGIVRALGARVGPDRLAVHPAPSSIAMAFARLGLPWDDATIVSAHGRPLDDAVRAAVDSGARKLAILTSPDAPPQAVGRALCDAGLGTRHAGEGTGVTVAVVTHVGGHGERVERTDLAGLAAGEFDPMSVVVVVRAPTADGPAGPTLAWDAGPTAAGGPGPSFGLPETAYEHRDGMITKAEVRAIVLSKLALPLGGVLWDVGAGSGSVGVECARLAPGLRVIAVERDPDQAERVLANAESHGVSVHVVEGSAPAALAGLPDPDRVFVGGGGLDVLDAVRDRLRPGGVVVATYALLDRAVAAHERLGNMAQVSVARAVPVGGIGVRLAPENPVFVCWGGGTP
jgi:precorrin-6Y C5,15-methyltransferase (decarboxylating)